MLLCETPKVAKERAINLSISNNGGSNLSLIPYLLRVNAKVDIISINPTSGYIGGNTYISIIVKEREVTPQSACLFDTVRVPIWKGNLPNDIICTSPSHSPGRSLVQLTSDMTNIVPIGHFTYHVEPIVMQLIPSHGPITGGTRVIIAGKHALSFYFIRPTSNWRCGYCRNTF
mmetsp:Transcript_39329/g.59110  ORF Transcript_39329/g.59110 Transcript_39329/m.59110 type:complete len:173 (+) Transcript_39329:486-1004(+)